MDISLSREFCRKHEALLRFLRDVYAESLVDLEREFARVRLMGRAESGAARQTCKVEVGIQVTLPSKRADAQVQATVTTQEKATWTGDPDPPAEEEGGDAPAAWEPPDEGVFAYASNIERCWNCASPAHFLDTCPLPRTRTFCYRCGRPGYTVMGCPDCGPEWRAQGAGRAGKRPNGKRSSRRRGKPPGALRSPSPTPGTAGPGGSR